MQNALVESTGPQEQLTTALEMRMMDYPAAHHAPQNDLLFLWENPGASDGVPQRVCSLATDDRLMAHV
jgi:hypothetical protein